MATQDLPCDRCVLTKIPCLFTMGKEKTGQRKEERMAEELIPASAVVTETMADSDETHLIIRGGKATTQLRSSPQISKCNSCWSKNQKVASCICIISFLVCLQL